MTKTLKRRRFLRGIAGATLALPFLESVEFRGSARADGDAPIYNFIFKQGNGVAQRQVLANGEEPERFWPHQTGALTREVLEGRDADRAVSVLAPMAEHLTIVAGLSMGGMGQCRHAASQAQLLSAQPVHRGDADSRAGGETVDWFIAQRCNPEGVEPLNLRSGRIEGHAISGGLSYRAPGDGGLRPQQNNPLSVYRDLFGSGSGGEFTDLVGPRRMSVNDLVRQDFDRLLSSPVLSSRDRSRLEDHQGFVRDMELRMTCAVPESDVGRLEAVGEQFESSEERFEVARLMMDLSAFAFACDLNRTAVLQMGDCADGTRYVVDGVRQNAFHAISHRTGVEADLQLVHHKIDRMMAETFLYFLERASDMTTASGEPLIDRCLAMWCNDLARGGHSLNNMPFILAGSAGGFLRTGQYVDVSGGRFDVGHQKLLNTLISANGITDSGGDHRFGSSSLAGGVLEQIIA